MPGAISQRVAAPSGPRRRENLTSTLSVIPERYVPAHDPAAHRRTTLAGLAGNVMEWYDFAVHGYFAPVIGKTFFPAEAPAASLIAAYGIFAAGFLMRPLGGLIFGHIGD